MVIPKLQVKTDVILILLYANQFMSTRTKWLSTEFLYYLDIIVISVIITILTCLNNAKALLQISFTLIIES